MPNSLYPPASRALSDTRKRLARAWREWQHNSRSKEKAVSPSCVSARVYTETGHHLVTLAQQGHGTERDGFEPTLCCSTDALFRILCKPSRTPQ